MLKKAKKTFIDYCDKYMVERTDLYNDQKNKENFQEEDSSNQSGVN